MFRSLRLGVRNPLIMARSASSSSNGPSGGLLSSYERFLTARSIARQPSPIRALQPFIGLPGMISLGGGMPNPSTFPFSNLSVTTTDGETLNFSGKELDQALQYSESAGLPQLTKLWKDLVKEEHKPHLPDDDWGVLVTGGSQDGLGKVFEMVFDEHSSLLVETPTYSGALAALQPMGGRLVEVATDGDGLIPESLDTVMRSWDEAKQGPRPKALYMIPCGSNPTGGTLSLERRKQLLRLATEHDLLIIEDDPYYYLQFGDRLPSLFSMCTDGRVIRCDSLSKLLSSGIRMGFVTAPAPLLQRLVLHQQATALHTSGISQAITYALLNSWNQKGNGFEEHVQKVVKLYRDRRDMFCGFCDKYLTGKATWTVPSAGMFVWFRVPKVNDTTDMIKNKAIEKKVLLVPGGAFMPNGGPCQYVRAAFSTASPEDMELAIQRFASLIDDA